ncbi:hypothetical protein CFC21_088680, partial [Triticum aestivum]
MPSRPAPFVHRFRLLRSAAVSPSSAPLPCSRPRLAIPFAQPTLRAPAFAAASSPLLRPVGARFSLFSS